MTVVDALQQALAAQHAAVYVYSALGAQASRDDQPGLHTNLTAAYRAHLERRNALETMVRSLGADPVAAEPAYRLPADLTTGRAIARAALRVERASAAAYAHLVANATGDARRFGINALLDAATRELEFGGRPRRLPGL